MQDMILCPSCRKPYNSPMLLQCRHSLCIDCCEKLFMKANCTIQCPVCRQMTQTPTIKTLTLNSELNELVQKMIKYSQQVQQVAVAVQPIQTQHSELPFMDLTNLQLISSSEGIQRASRGENIKTLEESAEILRPKLQENINMLKSKQNELQNRTLIIDSLQENLNASYSQTDQAIRQYFEQLHNVVTDRMNELLHQNQQNQQIQFNENNVLKQKLQEYVDLTQQSLTLDISNSSSETICKTFIQVKSALNQLQNEQFAPKSSCQCQFISNDSIFSLIKQSFQVNLVDNFNEVVKQVRANLKIDVKKSYNFEKERMCDDDSMKAESFTKSIIENNKKLIEAIDLNGPIQKVLANAQFQQQDKEKIFIALSIGKIQEVPHEFFEGMISYFKMLQQFYTNIQNDLDKKIQQFIQVSEVISKLNLQDCPIVKCPAVDYSEKIFKELNSEYKNFAQFFKDLASDFRIQLVSFVVDNQQQYQKQVESCQKQYKEEVSAFDERVKQLQTLQDQVSQQLEKFKKEEQSQLDQIQKAEKKKQQSVNVKRAEQTYQQKLNTFNQQLSLFLTFELNTRRKINQIVTQLEELEYQRVSFVQQLVQNTHQIIQTNIIKLIVNQQGTTSDAQKVLLNQPIINLIYATLKTDVTTQQISPPLFKNFKQNLLQQYQLKIDQIGRKLDPNEQLRAPTGAIGIAVAEFDYEPEEDVKDEALPLHQDQEYWIFEYDELGWSIVAAKEYPAVKMVAPSNYLKLVKDAFLNYKWSGQVLVQCGGIGISGMETQKIIIQQKQDIELQKFRVVTAQYDYDPTDKDELAFKEGDKLTVQETLEGGEWLRGVNLRTQQQGMYPKNYVNYE